MNIINNNSKISFKRINLLLLNFVLSIVPLIYLPYFSKYNDSILHIIDKNGTIYNSMRDTIYGPKVETIYLVVALLLISLLVGLRKEEVKTRWKPIYLPLTMLTLLIFISTILSPYKSLAIYGRPHRREGFVTLISYIILFFTTINTISSKKDLKRTVNFFLISGFIVSIYGVLQYFNFDPIPRDPVRANWSGRAFSTLGNPNFAGSYASMLLPISFTLFIDSIKRKSTILLGILTTTSYALLLSTGTRSAYLAILLIIPIGLYLLKERLLKNKRRLSFILIAFIAVSLFFNYSSNGYFTQRMLSIFFDGRTLLTDIESADRGGASRVFIYRTSIPLLIQSPLIGEGPDSFQHIYPQELFQEFRGSSAILDKAHSEYLQIGITMGIPALLAYLWFLFKVIKVNIKKLKVENSSYDTALFLAVISYLIQATFNISAVSVAPVFWIILGLSFVEYKEVKKNAEA